MSWYSRSPTSQDTSTLPINAPTTTGTSFPDDDIPIQSGGGYTIDFENLDSVNPFQSSNRMMLSPPKPLAQLSDTLTLTEPIPPALSPALEEVKTATEKADLALDETLPFIPSVENSLTDVSADGTVIIEPRKPALTEGSADDTVNIDGPDPAPADVTDSSLLSKGSYQIDFENLDSMNPFKAGGLKIQNSPPVCKTPVQDPVPFNAEETGSGVRDQEMPREHHNLPTVEKPKLPEVSPDPTSPSTALPKEAPVVLEFNFDDGAKVKCRPPPKRLGLKRPPLSRTKSDASKPGSALAEKKSPKPKSCETLTDSAAVECPPAAGTYSIDFDRFDDPNFNPFGTTTKMGSSPPRDALKVTEVPERPAESPTHR